MFTPIGVAIHNSTGSGLVSSCNSGAAFALGAGEFVLGLLTWETGNPSSINYADNAAANKFGTGSVFYDSADGKGLQFFWIADTVAVPNCVVTASLVGATGEFFDITLLRYAKHGTVTVVAQSAANIQAGVTDVALPTCSGGDLNVAAVKLFASRTLPAPWPKKYKPRYGGETSTSHHLLVGNQPLSSALADTLTLSASQNALSATISFSDSGSFPAATKIPSWYLKITPGNVGAIPAVGPSDAGLVERNLNNGSWNERLCLSYSGATVATKSLQVGSGTTINGPALIVNGGGHSTGGANPTMAFGPLQAEYPSWWKLRDTTQPLVIDVANDANGNLAGAHTYNAMYFDGSGTRNRVLFPGRLFRHSDAASDARASYFDLAQADPQTNQPWNILSGTNLGLIWSVYDQANQRVIGCKYPQSTGTVVVYDVAADTTTTFTGKTDIGGTEFFSALDTKRQIALILLRNSSTAYTYDVSNVGANNYAALSAAGTPPPAAAWSSVIYDPVDDRFVIYAGSNILYYLTNVAGTWTWSAQGFGGATTDAADSTGTYGRFAYFQFGSMRGYLLFNQYNSQVFLFRPSSAIVPGLSETSRADPKSLLRRARSLLNLLDPFNWGARPFAVEKWFADELAPAGSGGPPVVGQVVENDVAQPIAATQVRLVAQVAETDAAQTVTVQLPRSVAQVLEQDSAQPIAANQVHVLGQPGENDAAQPIVAQLVRSLGQPAEQDAAQPIAAQLIRSVAQVSEADSAQPIGARLVAGVAQASENDLAQPIALRLVQAVVQAQESDTAQPMVARVVRTVAQVAESDAAQAVSLGSTGLGVSQVQESDAAQPVQGLTRTAVAQVAEQDAAQPVGARLVAGVGIAAESDAAQPIAARLVRVVTQVAETDLAQPFLPGGFVPVSPAAEADTAQPISARLSRTVSQAVENDAAQPFTPGISATVGQAGDQEAAQAFVLRLLQTVAQVQELDVAGSIQEPGAPEPEQPSTGTGGIGRLVTPSYRMQPPRRKRRPGEDQQQVGTAVDLAPGPLAGTAAAAPAPAPIQPAAEVDRWRLAREQDLEFETKVLHLI